jgi:hypothetical protein
MKTQLQRTADHLDCDLYRIICSVEGLYADAQKQQDRDLMKVIKEVLDGLRSARPHLRRLMNEEDRKATS